MCIFCKFCVISLRWQNVFFYGEILTDHDGFAEEIRVTERVARSWERKKKFVSFLHMSVATRGGRDYLSPTLLVCVCLLF